MAEVEADFPDDACREFAEALLRGDYDGDGGVGIEENEFVNLVRGEPGCGFADLVGG